MTTFDERFEKLLSMVGTPYRMFDDNGNYEGCFLPIYTLYPQGKHYKLPSENPQKNYLYGMAKIRRQAHEITREELHKGDIIACMYNDELHVAIYWEYGKIIHVFRKHELFISKIDMLKYDMSYWRVNV